jgi:hypothetical protein
VNRSSSSFLSGRNKFHNMKIICLSGTELPHEYPVSLKRHTKFLVKFSVALHRNSQTSVYLKGSVIFLGFRLLLSKNHVSILRSLIEIYNIQSALQSSKLLQAVKVKVKLSLCFN